MSEITIGLETAKWLIPLAFIYFALLTRRALLVLITSTFASVMFLYLLVASMQDVYFFALISCLAFAYYSFDKLLEGGD